MATFDEINNSRERLISGKHTEADVAFLSQRPINFLPRPEEIKNLKEKVLGESSQAVAVTGAVHKVGVQGMGGIGKSVLVAELARDEEVRRRFSNGIVWITPGQ